MTAETRPERAPDLVPPWLARAAALGWRILVTVALAFVLVQVAVILGTVTAAIAIGLIVSATFAPYVRALRARGWDRTKAAAAVFVLAIVAVTVLLGVLVWAFWPYVADLLGALRNGGEEIRHQVQAADLPPVVSAIAKAIGDAVTGVLTTIGAEVAGPIAEFITALILGGFLTFFLLQDGDRAWDWLMRPIQGWRAASITEQAVVALDRVGGYLRGTAVLGAIRAVTDFAFLTALGVPLAAPLAVLVFLASFVPYLGGLFAMLALLIVTYSAQGGTATIILFALIAVVSLVLGRFVGPVVYGRRLHVHPALVLIALPAGAALFGAMGLFVALPVVASVMTIAPAVVHALGLDPEAALVRKGGVPVWLDRLAQWSWRGLVITGVLGLVVAAAIRIPIVVMPLVLALVLAATLRPAAIALRARGWSPGAAALGSTLGTTVIILGVSLVAILAMIGPLEEMLGTADAGAEQGILATLGVAQVVHSITSGLLKNVIDLVQASAFVGVVILLAVLLTFYFLRDGPRLWEGALARVEPGRRRALGPAGSQAVGVLGGYMIGTGVISLFGAATTAIIMFVLGLPLILPIAVLSFFLGFIPYIGSFIATGLAFLVTVSVGTTTDIVVMAVFTIIFNIAQGNFVAPLVYGRAVNLHPAIVLMAIPAGGALAGMVGMFLVVPFLGVVAVTWRTILHQFDEDGPLLIDPSSVPPIADDTGPNAAAGSAAERAPA